MAIINRPENLKPLGVYLVTSDYIPISMRTTRALQIVGLAGTGVAAAFAGKQIIESDRPVIEATRQISLFGAAYTGGVVAGEAAILPCSGLGLTFPPAAPVTVPLCIAGASVTGGALAAVGLDLALEQLSKLGF